MKKLTLIIFVLCAVCFVQADDFPGLTDYTWKGYSQVQSAYCCGNSDSNQVYWIVEFQFSWDNDPLHPGNYKVYNRHGTSQIGYWNESEGPMDGRVYFSPNINNVGWFNFSFTQNSLFIKGANSDRNIVCVRGFSV